MIGANMQEAISLGYDILELIDTPKALTVYLLTKYREFGQLQELQVDPLHYSSAEGFALDYQAISLLRKSEWIEADPVALEAATLKKWWASEHLCFRTNRFLCDLPSKEGPYFELTRAIMARARRWIKKVLGPVPDELEVKFGPGSNVSIPSRRCDVITKIATPFPTATTSLKSWAPYFSQYQWPGRVDLDYVRGNHYFTVAKDWRSRRPCGKEPVVNGAYQLGAGMHVRQRLLRFGFDLADQKAHHELARKGSLDGELATLDLSSASDTICIQLVQDLLPEEWFLLLNDLRSSHTRVNGRWVRLEKFSSMGCGFTFELETLIFAGIIHGVTGLGHICKSPIGHGFSAYGDDIIVPSDYSEDVKAALQTFGFEINTKKSFTVGSFRESCGGDFFLGVDVVPYRAGGVPSCPADWFDLHNGLYRWLETRGLIHSPKWLSLLRKLRRQVPKSMRLHVPMELGCLGFWGGSPIWRVRDSIRSVRVVRSSPRKKWWVYDSESALISQLLGYRFDEDWRRKRFLIRRGVEYMYKVGWTPFS